MYTQPLVALTYTNVKAAPFVETTKLELAPKILGETNNLVVSTNGAAFTLVYVNATRGWVYKDKI